MPLRQAPIRPVAGWRFRAQQPDVATLAWLLDPGSLTARLIALSQGRFRVRLTSLRRERPSLAECRALHLNPAERALVREVVLEGGGVPWVVARSVIPRQTLTGRNRQLLHLGNRPLGAFLFRDPTLVRRQVDIVQIASSNKTARASAHPVWGRRSTFVLRGRPLLVAEYFLPALLSSGTSRMRATGPADQSGPGAMSR